MATIYAIWGKNEEKEWPVTSYIDVYSTKKHFMKLEEYANQSEEYKKENKNIYDPTGNIPTGYYVIKMSSFMTFDGFKAYMQIDEYAREVVTEVEVAV